jgi:hypothetical protein
MGTGWLLNRAVNSRWIVAYQAEKVHGKLHTVRPDEKLTRRPDAGLMVESSFQRLTRHFNNNHLVLREFRLSICKRKQQKWHEFGWSCLAHVKSPSQVGSKQHQIGIKCVYSHPFAQHHRHCTDG